MPRLENISVKLMFGGKGRCDISKNLAILESKLPKYNFAAYQKIDNLKVFCHSG